MGLMDRMLNLLLMKKEPISIYISVVKEPIHLDSDKSLADTEVSISINHHFLSN